MTPAAIREEYECIAQDVDHASIMMQRTVNDSDANFKLTPIELEDIDRDLHDLRRQVGRLEALRLHLDQVPASLPT